MSEKGEAVSRRTFLTAAALAAAACETRREEGGGGAVDRRRRRWLRCAVIGTGIRGRELLSLIVNVPRVSVKAICDVVPEHLEFARKITGTGVQTYSCHRELLEREEDLDAVIIATPLHEHARMTTDALKAGTHVFCETALARTRQECLQIWEASKASDKVFQAGFQGVFNPLFSKAAEMVGEGKVGRVSNIRAQWHMNDDYRLPVADPSLERVINWRMYREFSGGLMAEFGSHQLEFVNRLLGARPARVVGLGGIDHWQDGREVYDNVSVVFEYPAGVKLVFTSLQNNAHNRACVEILGSEGSIDLSLEGGKFFSEKPPVTAAIRSVEGLAPPSGPSFKLFGSTRDEGEILKVQLDDKNSGYLQMEAFFECIHEGGRPACDVKAAYDATVAALAANEAMDELRPVACGYQV